MRIDDWYKSEQQKLGARRKAVTDRAIELAKVLDVSLDDPRKMELLHSLAIAETANGPAPALPDIRNDQ